MVNLEDLEALAIEDMANLDTEASIDLSTTSLTRSNMDSLMDTRTPLPTELIGQEKRNQTLDSRNPRAWIKLFVYCLFC